MAESPSEPAPLVSVVTAVRNARDALAATIDSVRRQRGVAIEHVVIDAASCDGTAELLARSGVVAVSEPDRGISEAFNKGIARSRGGWILMLNAGDVLIGDDALAIAAASFRAAPIVTAFSRLGQATVPQRALSQRDPLPRRAWISHQASFVRRDVYERFGRYRCSYRVRMDYEFWLRVLPHVPMHFIDRPLVEMLPGGISSRAIARFHWEEIRANLERLPHPWRANAQALHRWWIAASARRTA